VADKAEVMRDARGRLLDAAEKLFAERGFEATSVRDITAEARCNLAAVNYHFGSKESLYQAAFSRLTKELRDWRERRLRADFQAAAHGAGLESLLRSFVIAYLEEFESEERRRRLQAFVDIEMRNQHLPPETFFRELMQPIQQLVLQLLLQVGPAMDAKAADFCVESLMGLLMHARKVRTLAPRIEIPAFYRGASEAELVSHIVSFTAGGIRACAKADTGKRNRRPTLRLGRAGKLRKRTHQ
jgi:AcrR family transcriptional regulator